MIEPAPQFRLNGRAYALPQQDPNETLLHWLQRQRLHGTKEGCGDGDCGACTVVLVESDGTGQRMMQAVNSCLLPMGALPGREVLTVEALADGDTLHPVQLALVDCAGSQCGYCTPGFVMSLFAGGHQGRLDDASFEGNLCRCTGYQPIRQAAAELRQQLPWVDRFSPLLNGPAEPLPAARLGGFHSPTELTVALQDKAARPAAGWIAGATDLGVALSHGQVNPAGYIALERIAELQQIEVDPQFVRIGAAVTLQRLQDELAGVFPALDQMLQWFAARQVRQRATLGGNLGSASPIGDLLPVLLALDAVIELASLRGRREVVIDEFFPAYRQTVCAADELIVSVRLPLQPGWRNASYKLAKRATDDISIVAAAFALQLDAAERVEQIRLAYGGVAATPQRALRAEGMLLGQRIERTVLDRVLAQLQVEFSPLDDHRGSAAYRRALCANLFARFLAEQGLEPRA